MKYNVSLTSSENDANNKVKKLIAPSSTVLEFGSANGRLTRYLKEELGCQVYIVELEKEAFEEAIQYAQDGVCGDILENKWMEKFCDIRFDYILFLDVLEHLYYPEQALSNCKTLLKDQGQIFVSIPNIANNAILINLFENRFNYTEIGLLDTTHIRFFAKENLPEFFEQAGYVIIGEDAVLADFNENEQYRTMRKIHPELLRLLDSRENGAIYQFVLTLQKKECVHPMQSIEIPSKSGKQMMCKVYYDTGKGFHEEESICKFIDEPSNFEYTFVFPTPVKACRLDPVENCGCIVKNIEVLSDIGYLETQASNGFIEDGYFVFYDADPQILVTIPINSTINWITVKLNVYVYQDLEVYKLCHQLLKKEQKIKQIVEEGLTITDQSSVLHSLLEQKKLEAEQFLTEKNHMLIEQEQSLAKSNEVLTTLLREKKIVQDELAQKNQEIMDQKQSLIKNEEVLTTLMREKTIMEEELSNYQHHYCLAIEQRDDLTNQLMLVNAEYAAIQQAFFWRISKPLRVILDLTKRTLKSYRLTGLFYKGLVSLRHCGVKATFQKTKLKLYRKGRKEVNSTAPIIICEQECKRQESTLFETRTKFSILVPLYNTPEHLLREMIESVVKQTYSDWELCIADGSDPKHHYVEKIVRNYQRSDQRIVYSKFDNRGISENSNCCAEMATGDYLVLLDHDDTLMKNALFEMKSAIDETGAPVLYSDEDRLDTSGNHCRAFYKPDWSPDLLYSQMYICHMFVFQRSLFWKVGGFDSNFDGAQDYDLMLRFSEHTQNIYHIPKVLYSWRETEGSTATDASAKPYAHLAGKNALNAHLKRRYNGKAFAIDGEYTFVYGVDFSALLTAKPKVSIIIPMRDRWTLSDQCIQSILNKSSYKNYEILILNNNSEEQATYEWFSSIQNQDERVRVIDAKFTFNWSMLNNFGMKHANGSVYIFLNNDTIVITTDWIERLSENALRDEIGVVGAQLLYEDHTIQHAGVVVGMGGWADHVFKGCSTSHEMSPFVSPMISRNVLAVTGACFAISKEKIDKIGSFDESFIICGSDVELCLRAYEKGLNNLYNANVKLYHLESKSRDSFIPEVDFDRSAWAYSPYREEGDPYFNINLNIDSNVPRGRDNMGRILCGMKHHLKRYKIVRNLYAGIKKSFSEPTTTDIPEATEMHGRIGNVLGLETRLNLMVPTVSKTQVFGGIATALEIFYPLVEQMGVKARVILTDTEYNAELSCLPDEYVHRDCMENIADQKQVISFGDRYNKTLPIEQGDLFVATAWWTAYALIPILRLQRETFPQQNNKLVYFIQDYEPGFYQWSSRYLMSESTYWLDIPTVAVFNSQLLKDFFKNNGYAFTHEICFDPILNISLRNYMEQVKTSVRKKQILVYGRPSVARNAFEVVVESLREWCCLQTDIAEWTLISAGEQHEDINLYNGKVLRSVGKLSLEEYAGIMLETYAGISLMVSPHPSYPPLEMAAFGIRTITNSYKNKDLSSFSKNIVSITNCSKYEIANRLTSICNDFKEYAVSDVPEDYINSLETFRRVAAEIKEIM